MEASRHARLFRNGRNQALRIPREFELPGDAVTITRDGHRLIVEPLPASALMAVLATLDPVTEAFPDIDAGTLPLDDVVL
jgi:antitoxin VapB